MQLVDEGSRVIVIHELYKNGQVEEANRLKERSLLIKEKSKKLQEEQIKLEGQIQDFIHINKDLGGKDCEHRKPHKENPAI